MLMFLFMVAFNLADPLHCPLQKLPPAPPHTVVYVAAADDGNDDDDDERRRVPPHLLPPTPRPRLQNLRSGDDDERRRVPPHLLPHRPTTPAYKTFIAILFVVATVVMLGLIARMVAVDSTNWVEALLMLPVMLLVMAIIVFIQAKANLTITRDFSAAATEGHDGGGGGGGGSQMLDQMEQV